MRQVECRVQATTDAHENAANCEDLVEAAAVLCNAAVMDEKACWAPRLGEKAEHELLCAVRVTCWVIE